MGKTPRTISTVSARRAGRRQDDRVDAIAELGFQTNWFRTLGLPANATQADIDAAARKMRLWKDPTRIPPTEWDFVWMGPLERDRGAIEAAVAALADPAVRLQQRLLWFCRPHPALVDGDAQRLKTDADALSPSGDPRDRHEAGLLALLTAARDPQMRERATMGRIGNDVKQLGRDHRKCDRGCVNVTMAAILKSRCDAEENNRGALAGLDQLIADVIMRRRAARAIDTDVEVCGYWLAVLDQVAGKFNRQDPLIASRKARGGIIDRMDSLIWSPVPDHLRNSRQRCPMRWPGDPQPPIDQPSEDVAVGDGFQSLNAAVAGGGGTAERRRLRPRLPHSRGSGHGISRLGDRVDPLRRIPYRRCHVRISAVADRKFLRKGPHSQRSVTKRGVGEPTAREVLVLLLPPTQNASPCPCALAAKWDRLA